MWNTPTSFSPYKLFIHPETDRLNLIIAIAIIIAIFLFFFFFRLFTFETGYLFLSAVTCKITCVLWTDLYRQDKDNQCMAS